MRRLRVKNRPPTPHPSANDAERGLSLHPVPNRPVVSKSTHIFYPLLTLLLILAQAANLVRGGHNVDAEARAVLASLPPETTLQGVRNARDTILWRLEASAFELKTVLDERKATQRALAWLDRQLDEFDKAAKEDAGGVRDWGVGGGVGEGEGDNENEEGEEEEVVDELDE